MMTTSHKRSHPRSPSPTLSSSSPFPSSKAARTSPPTDTNATARNLLCTLPPTCNPPNKPTSLTDSAALEAHYATYHAHVCEEQGCRCVFPEARLLELVSPPFIVRLHPDSDKFQQHQTECHDPIAAMRKERGEKIVCTPLSLFCVSNASCSLHAIFRLVIVYSTHPRLGAFILFRLMVSRRNISLLSRTKASGDY